MSDESTGEFRSLLSVIKSGVRGWFRAYIDAPLYAQLTLCVSVAATLRLTIWGP